MIYNKVIIDGTEYTDEAVVASGMFIVKESIDYTDTIETNKEASFKLRQVDSYVQLSKYMLVKIYRLDILLFEGFIVEINSVINARSGIRDSSISCIGNEYRAKKGIPVGKVYKNDTYATVDLMVSHIYTNYLVREGVKLGLIEGSDIDLDVFTFNYLSAFNCLDLICERTNMIWYIDENRYFYFINRNTKVAQISLTWGSRIINYDTLNVKRLNDKYRNVQYAIGGRIKTSTLEEVQYGDGSKTTFTMPYSIAELPVVLVDRGSGFIEETVSAKTETLSGGTQWFYEYDSKEIVQGSGEITLATSDKIKTQFIGLVKAVIVSRNEEEVYKKALIDGTSGEIINVETVDRDGLAEIKQFNTDRLDFYAVDSIEVEFETWRNGFRAGMTITGNDIEEEALTEDLLITEVQYKQTGDVMTYKVTAVYGPLNEAWTDFYTKEKERKSEELISGSSIDTVTQILNYTKNWLSTDSPNLFQQTLTIPFTVTAVFGFSGFTRNRYLAWYDASGTELGRTAILLESADDDEDPTELTTIAFIPEIVEEDIRYLGWIGGQSATLETDTGYILDQQAVVLNKTTLDIYQVQKIDYKWS